jgi:hypothetical protein
MDDHELVRRIGALADEEHRLEDSHRGKRPTEDDVERLRQIEVALDQCWDLLRQRRARREHGQDPNAAEARPEETVEGYEQ